MEPDFITIANLLGITGLLPSNIIRFFCSSAVGGPENYIDVVVDRVSPTNQDIRRLGGQDIVFYTVSSYITLAPAEFVPVGGGVFRIGDLFNGCPEGSATRNERFNTPVPTSTPSTTPSVTRTPAQSQTPIVSVTPSVTKTPVPTPSPSPTDEQPTWVDCTTEQRNVGSPPSDYVQDSFSGGICWRPVPDVGFIPSLNNIEFFYQRATSNFPQPLSFTAENSSDTFSYNVRFETNNEFFTITPSVIYLPPLGQQRFTIAVSNNVINQLDDGRSGFGLQVDITPV